MKPRMTVLVALLVVAVALMVMLGRCSRRYPSMADCASGGDTIDVAIEYSPMSLYMYDDTLGGFNHDLLCLLESEYGITLKLHPMTSLSIALERLNDGTYDVVAAQVPMTTEFKSDYLFTDPIYIDKQVLVQRKDSAGSLAVRTQLDLAGKTVCIAKGSPVKDRINNLSAEIGDSIFVKEMDYSQEQLFLLVASGEVSLAVVNDYTAVRLSPKYPDVDKSTPVSFNQFHSWVVRKDDNELLDMINKRLSQVKTMPRYKELMKRYGVEDK